MLKNKRQPRPFPHFSAECKAIAGTSQAELHLRVWQGLSRMTAWLDCSPGSPELVTPQEGTEQAAVLTLEPAWSQRKRLAGGRPLGHRWGF